MSNDFLTPEILQLGSTAVVAITAIFALLQVIKNKQKDRRKNDEIILKELQLLKENDMHGVHGKLDGIRDRLRELDNKIERSIIELVEIKTILKNKR